MKIILLRHLDTIYSREHRICGQTDCDILPNGKLIIPDEVMKILDTEKFKIYITIKALFGNNKILSRERELF